MPITTSTKPWAFAKNVATEVKAGKPGETTRERFVRFRAVIEAGRATRREAHA